MIKFRSRRMILQIKMKKERHIDLMNRVGDEISKIMQLFVRLFVSLILIQARRAHAHAHSENPQLSLCFFFVRERINFFLLSISCLSHVVNMVKRYEKNTASKISRHSLTFVFKNFICCTISPHKYADANLESNDLLVRWFHFNHILYTCNAFLIAVSVVVVLHAYRFRFHSNK